MLKCIIVDDEQFSIDALTTYIEKIPDMKIVARYLDPVQALHSISTNSSIDILFMDIDMPEMSGLELAKELRTKTGKIVFTTSHSKYAFEAYEAAGDAYLLKPFTFAKFSSTINRLVNGIRAARQTEIGTNEYFLVKSKEDDLSIVKVKFNEVIVFESAQNYIKIYLNSGKEIIAYLTLKDILQLVSADPEFIQIHRSFIISTEYINAIKGNLVVMSNGLSMPVGDLYKERFTNYINDKLMITSRKN